MTSRVHSPTAGRRRLRNTLRRVRDQVRLTQEQVAEAMDWSLSKVIRIETGGVGISTSDLRQLLQLYEVSDPDQVAELVELARVGRRRPWWTQFREALPAGYLSYIGLEDESSALRCVSPVGLPGLLQTEEYSRAVVEASWWAVRPSAHGPATATDRINVRQIRQREVLHRDRPPEITAILDEAVLWRQIGGPEVLRRQLRHLVTLGSEPHITIQVLPFSASMMNMLSHFVLMEFSDPADPDAVYVESAFDHTLLEGEEIETYRNAFSRLRDASLAAEDSLTLIEQVADRLA
ncbi:helix-turn-helix transcriptional regulator [Natronosporangium hydrolyticum]|uniref:Helix-turn-helix transcriptional regulator n=1 Tax=Natronosporangium hydrolyticum TaxID=2811111 RepID=A0A895Y7J2_9ACTN|nr:helix-turn-helix transcriptional regulator [Natronosporangium hydrolyticum]QSB13704.1 helix-turn-helix transcriptional regulator [Natronosporangium hydrolyticum]